MDYLKLITIMNQTIYELIPEDNQDLMTFIEENSPISFESIGYAHVISFLNFPIWCSNNDERPYENEDDPKLCDYIPLEKWLWQEIIKILTLINQLKVYLINIKEK